MPIPKGIVSRGRARKVGQSRPTAPLPSGFLEGDLESPDELVAYGFDANTELKTRPSQQRLAASLEEACEQVRGSIGTRTTTTATTRAGGREEGGEELGEAVGEEVGEEAAAAAAAAAAAQIAAVGLSDSSSSSYRPASATPTASAMAAAPAAAASSSSFSLAPRPAAPPAAAASASSPSTSSAPPPLPPPADTTEPVGASVAMLPRGQIPRRISYDSEPCFRLLRQWISALEVWEEEGLPESAIIDARDAVNQRVAELHHEYTSSEVRPGRVVSTPGAGQVGASSTPSRPATAQGQHHPKLGRQLGNLALTAAAAAACAPVSTLPAPGQSRKRAREAPGLDAARSALQPYAKKLQSWLQERGEQSTIECKHFLRYFPGYEEAMKEHKVLNPGKFGKIFPDLFITTSRRVQGSVHKTVFIAAAEREARG